MMFTLLKGFGTVLIIILITTIAIWVLSYEIVLIILMGLLTLLFFYAVGVLVESFL